MSMKIRRMIMLVLVMVTVVFSLWVLRLSKEPDANETSKSTRRERRSREPLLTQKSAKTSAVKPVAVQKTDGKAKGKGKRPGRRFGRIASGDGDGVFRDSDGKPYPEEDQNVMALAAAAVENDDMVGARALAEAALSSGNRDLREAVVEALGWFGEDTMVELVPFLSDPDESIAETARSHWMDGLQQIKDDGMKAGVIEMTLKAITNKDMIEDVANELIGIDELAAVQVVVDVIESGGAAVRAAKEVYNSITGDDWKDVDAAEAWLQENYMPEDAN